MCYVGISFYRSLDKQSLLTSVAQVFNDRGDGIVVPAKHAYDLLRDAIERYYETHQTLPARIVIHKSSRFDNNEKAGFAAALQQRAIATHDLLWIYQGRHETLSCRTVSATARHAP